MNLEEEVVDLSGDGVSRCVCLRLVLLWLTLSRL